VSNWTPEDLLRCYATIPEAPHFLRSLMQHWLTKGGTPENCRHLLPLFENDQEQVTYFDLYLAHYRWSGGLRWRELCAASGSPDEALRALPGPSSADDWGIVEALCEASRRLAASDHEAAVRCATAAVERAERVPVDVLGKQCRHELQALALATVANAHRAHDHLPEARLAMAQALTNLEAGKPHLLGLATVVLSLRSGLEFWEAQYEQAVQTLDEALEADPPPSLRARLLVQRTNTLITLKDATGALLSLEEALPLIDREADPRLWYCALEHQLFILTELGRLDEAAALLPAVRALVGENGTPIHQTQVRWVEARLAAGQGDLAAAEDLYHEVRRAFLGHQLAYSAAIVTLELAELLLEQGRLEEVEIHAASTLEEFRRQRAESQYIGALTLVEQAVARQRLTLKILRQARGLVEKREAGQ
jgi:tetratricopeptide (TPR) repeat protein